MAAVLETVLHARREANSAFARAVLASIAIHALIILLLPGLLDTARPPQKESGPIVARLAQMQSVPVPAPAPEEQPVRGTQTARQPPPQPLLQPAQNRHLAGGGQPAPEAPPASPVPSGPSMVLPAVEKAQNAPPPERAIAAARVESTPIAPPAAGPAANAADPGTLGQYRIAIISAARRFKTYPRIAMDNGWEGRAEVRMVIDANGTLAAISIRIGSGFEALDQQALEMIRKAKPLAPIPSVLRGKGFTLDIPVLFSLKEETG